MNYSHSLSLLISSFYIIDIFNNLKIVAYFKTQLLNLSLDLTALSYGHYKKKYIYEKSSFFHCAHIHNLLWIYIINLSFYPFYTKHLALLRG